MNEPVHDTYPGLDSLRALAAIAVLATHTSFWTGQYSKGLLGAATSRLDIGVAFFFVLSGFLLSRPFLAAIANGHRAPSAGRYLWKRALRILPLYWIIVVIALVSLEDNRGFGVGDWIRSLTLTNIYFTGAFPAGLTQMWSLAIEIAFYALLPILLGAVAWTICRQGWNPGRIVGAVGLLAVLNIAWLLFVAPHRLGAGQWLPSFLTWFGVGLLFATASIELRRRPGHRVLGVLIELAHHPATCWTMALSLFVVATTPVAGPTLLIPPTYGEAITKNLLYAAIAGLVVIPSIFGPHAGTRYSNLLGSGGLRHIGMISYSIFSVHLLVIHFIAAWRDIPLFQGRGWELFLLTLVVSLIASELLYRLVEMPLMRFRNARVGSSKTRTAAAPNDATTAN